MHKKCHAASKGYNGLNSLGSGGVSKKLIHDGDSLLNGEGHESENLCCSCKEAIFFIKQKR
ncbi:hypothetical protein [Abyssisolibacter fermentans]|uniref:hypothetical protein n=1 Tax=Abyssisolibacter fermentans TaxID=1766203 RepID=UPI00138F62B7|nr:hypothetical protein [Abyssisolibacter fermentans]